MINQYSISQKTVHKTVSESVKSIWYVTSEEYFTYINQQQQNILEKLVVQRKQLKIKEIEKSLLEIETKERELKDWKKKQKANDRNIDNIFETKMKQLESEKNALDNEKNELCKELEANTNL